MFDARAKELKKRECEIGNENNVKFQAGYVTHRTYSFLVNRSSIKLSNPLSNFIAVKRELGLLFS